MNDYTLPSEFSWIIAGVFYGTILLFLIRFLLMCSSIKRKSELFSELEKLNNKYISHFHAIQRSIKINFECKSLQQYRNNCNKISIINYMCGRVRENEEEWKGLYNKANHNKKVFTKYINEYELIKTVHSGKSYKAIKKRTFFFSEKQYLKFEQKYCNEKMLRPEITLNIVVNVNYTSPAGRNIYATEYKLANESVDEIFTRIEDRKKSENSIDYQRALMTSGKRYDILRRDHYKCQICGRSQSDGVRLEIDHIIPISKGGKTTDENLQTLCHECNQGKKDKF